MRRTGQRTAAVALAALFIAGAAHAQGAGSPGDPWEKMNRGLYSIHQTLDHAFFRPLAMIYKAVLPAPLRKGLRNVIANLGKPVVFANDIVQHRFTDAGMTLTRFATNTTVGIGGLFDMATRAGVPDHDNGFGATLGRYGAGPGPYIFIPLVGPTTVRDLIGKGVDVASDPLTWARYSGDAGASAARTAVSGLDTRAEVDDQLKHLDDQSTDPYATLRSVYLQNRQAEIAGGQGPIEDLPDFGSEVTSSAGADAARHKHQAAPPAEPALPDIPSADAPPAAPPAAEPPAATPPAPTP